MPLEQAAALLKPGLTLPRPKLARAIERRVLDARTIEWRAAERPWTRAPIWALDVLDALDAGEDYVAMLGRYAKRFPDESRTRFADELVRRQLLAFHDAGAVDLALDEAPDLGPRYQREKLLGRGGFGLAWLARDTHTGAQVVVKRAWSWYHPLAVAEAVVRNEARVGAALDHPGIPRLVDTFERDGALHVVRAFVDGAPLSRESKRTATRDVLADATSIARIVEHVHARGFLALDLGPSNFFRATADGRIVMIDVGACYPHENGAATLPHLTGNRGYVSPEVRRERTASVRSDVWSLGKLVLAFATRRPPKDKWTPAEVDALLPDAQLRSIVRSFTADDPAARPATMRDARRALEEALAPRPELSPGVIRIARPIRWRWLADHSALEMFDVRLDRWSKYHPWVGVVLEGLERGASFGEMVEAVALADKKTSAAADKMTRSFLYGLRQAGHLDLGLPEPPRAFGDRYRIVRELGRGAVGVAYECVDASSGAAVVVKQPWAFFTALASAESHIRHEGDVLRALDHPRIVPFVDAFDHEGRAHLARGYVDGAPYALAPMSADELDAFAREVADILAHAHARGFAIVDMLPSNFLRTKNGPMLVDVGLARPLGADGARADAKAFGGLLFAMVTGILPQRGWGEAELAARLKDHAWAPRILALARGEGEISPSWARA